MKTRHKKRKGLPYAVKIALISALINLFGELLELINNIIANNSGN